MYINLFSKLLRDYCTRSNFAETFKAFENKNLHDLKDIVSQKHFSRNHILLN